MPEGLEAEIWRRAAVSLIGRRITSVWVDERVAPPEFVGEVTGSTVTDVRRLGKVLLLDTTHPTHTTHPNHPTHRTHPTHPTGPRRLGQDSADPVLQNPDSNGGSGDATVAIGVHFGMTGRLVIDGVAPIERLEYASGRDDPAWDRLVIGTDPPPRPVASPHRAAARGEGADANDTVVAALRFNDPRRLGHVSLDPDLTHLGVDMLRVTARRLAPGLARRRTAIKVALLDQSVVAGLGNLLADEVLWWSGVSPHRGADSLDETEVGRLATAIRRRLPIMLRRGGSTTGTLGPAVRACCPPCPRDGTPLRRETIGARTAVWCPGHQR